MRIDFENAGDVVVAMLSEDSLEASNVEVFKGRIGETIDKGPKVLIDLTGLSFIDSSGLGALLSCHKQAKAGGVDLKLCGAAQPVRSLFEMVGVDQVLDVCGTREEAFVQFADDQ